MCHNITIMIEMLKFFMKMFDIIFGKFNGWIGGLWALTHSPSRVEVTHWPSFNLLGYFSCLEPVLGDQFVSMETFGSHWIYSFRGVWISFNLPLWMCLIYSCGNELFFMNKCLDLKHRSFANKSFNLETISRIIFSIV